MNKKQFLICGVATLWIVITGIRLFIIYKSQIGNNSGSISRELFGNAQFILRFVSYSLPVIFVATILVYIFRSK